MQKGLYKKGFDPLDIGLEDYQYENLSDLSHILLEYAEEVARSYGVSKEDIKIYYHPIVGEHVINIKGHFAGYLSCLESEPD